MISFVIAARNEEKALPRTIESLSRYRGPREIIVADDRSEDGTPAVAAKMADVFIENKGGERLTISANRNAGAARAKGEYIVFADADSHVKDAEDFFSRAKDMFDKDSRLVGLTFFTRFSPDVETWVDRIFLAYFNWTGLLINLLGRGATVGKLHMVKASAFRAVDGYDPKIVAGEDNELFHRLARKGRTRCAASLVTYHSGRRQHALGWGRVVLQWALNDLAVLFFRRARSKEWTEVR